MDETTLESVTCLYGIPFWFPVNTLDNILGFHYTLVIGYIIFLNT